MKASNHILQVNAECAKYNTVPSPNAVSRKIISFVCTQTDENFHQQTHASGNAQVFQMA